MAEQTGAGHSFAPGISRATAFRPHVTFRVALLVLVVSFALLAGGRVLRDDPLGDPVPVVMLLVLLLASAYAAARAWTTRVWVDTSHPAGWVPGTSPDPGRRATIAELVAGMPASRTVFAMEAAGLTGLRHHEVLLEHPTTLRLSGASFTGVRPSWRLAVTGPRSTGGPARTVKVRAPWLTDVRPLVQRLRPFVERDERLAADPDTLVLLLGRRPLDEPR